MKLSDSHGNIVARRQLHDEIGYQHFNRGQLVLQVGVENGVLVISTSTLFMQVYISTFIMKLSSLNPSFISSEINFRLIFEKVLQSL